MHGRSFWCLSSKIYARNAQSQPFNFQISGKSPYFQNSFLWLIDYSCSIVTLHTPTLHQTIGYHLGILQNFSTLSYDVYLRSYKLPNSSHFFPRDPKSTLECTLKTLFVRLLFSFMLIIAIFFGLPGLLHIRPESRPSGSGCRSHPRLRTHKRMVWGELSPEMW